MQHLLFVKVDSVVMHTTGITTTSRMLSVLACRVEKFRLTTYHKCRDRATPLSRPPKLTNATMSVADMSSELPGLGLLGRLSRQV